MEGQPQEPATLVLRVEGPMALEIQHSSDVILERVNRFFGWSAVGRLALRQAPLSRRERPARPRPLDPKTVQEVDKTLSAVEDEALKDALARTGGTYLVADGKEGTISAVDPERLAISGGSAGGYTGCRGDLQIGGRRVPARHDRARAGRVRAPRPTGRQAAC